MSNGNRKDSQAETLQEEIDILRKVLRQAYEIVQTIEDPAE